VELKSWLDLRDDADRANLAHALLALANHGGGYAILGFSEVEGRWVRSTGASPSGSYDQDTVNQIVKKYADPAFHCEAHRIVRGEFVHLVVTVPGGLKVPVRARAAGPDNKHVKKDAYYIRRPGPESGPPGSAAEWDALIGRCVRAAKDEIADIVRAAVAGSTTVTAPTASERLAEWVESSEARLAELVRDNLGGEAPSRYAHGTWSFSYALDPPVHLNLKELDAALRKAAEVHVTGWPTFLVITRDDYAPYPFENVVEAWIREPGAYHDGAHSDFWRAAPDGRLFLTRGYQEDADLKGVEAGTALDRGLPIWRIGECLLHVQRFAQLVDRGDARAAVRAKWTGLKGRRLGDFAGDWRTGSEGRPCRQGVVVSDVVLDVATIRAAIGQHVARITEPLYAAFDFNALPEQRVEVELRKLLRRA
jgi:hypothetical protein